MYNVSRDYSRPPNIRTVWSRETTTDGSPPHPSFAHTEIATLQEGLYQGVVIPRFSQKKKEGKLLPHTSYWRYDMHASQSGYRRLQWGTRVAEIGSCGILEDFDLTVDDGDLQTMFAESFGDQDHLVTEALAKLYNGFDYLTFLGELSSTLAMVLTLRKRAVELLTRKPSEKDPANIWLEWSYGWTPLINDIDAIAKMLNDKGPPPITTLVRRANFSYNLDRHLEKVLPNGEIHYVSVQDAVTAGAVGTAALKTSQSRDGAYGSLAVTAYELIPYSFVLDWFVDFGSWIKANLALFNSPEKTASLGRSIRINRTATLRGAPGGALTSYYVQGKAHVNAELRFRIPRSSSLTIPTFDGLSWRQLISGAALLLQRLT